MAKKLRLKYVGDGSFLPGFPVRDLSESEVKLFGLDALLASGLYEEIKEEPDKAPVKKLEVENVRNQET
jgi:hypothetical protein